MRKYLDLRRYTLKQPELIAFAVIDQEPPDDDTSYTSNKSLSVTGIICGYGIRYAAVLKYLDDRFEVFLIPSGTERTNQRVRDFLVNEAVNRFIKVLSRDSEEGMFRHSSVIFR